MKDIFEPISDCCGADVHTEHDFINDGELLEMTCNDCGDDCVDIHFDFDKFCEEHPDFNDALNGDLEFC